MKITSVLLTGANGFIGRAVLEHLLGTSKFSVRVALRRNVDGLPECLDTVQVGDFGPDNDWRAALDGIDVVIHTAARVHVMDDNSADPLTEFRRVNLYGTYNIAQQAIAAGVKRLIFISSIKVNGEETKVGMLFTEDDIPNPVDSYGISKAETEKALLELASSTGLDVVIIRPVLVYGPGVKANFLSMMKWLNRGVPLPLGAIHNKRSLLALDNLVDLIITCIEHPAAANQIFIASDGDDLSTTELLQRVGDALGRPAKLVSVPTGIIKIVARLLGKHAVSQRLLGSLQVDITKTRELLNWQPPVSVDEELKKTVQAFLQQQRV